ncbi:hypothetical protein K3495_g17461 [Podosphaera aphanis]|nr:hypothetical protein K3495_g17461 [Podosphaera aphanis]
MRFHDFITIFEDNMADSSYSREDKSQWRVMLQRRLSTRLRNALVMVSDAPRDYHEFVAYLREKDAGFYEIQASSTRPAPISTPAAKLSWKLTLPTSLLQRCSPSTMRQES